MMRHEWNKTRHRTRDPEHGRDEVAITKAVYVSPFRLSLQDGEPGVDVSARTLGPTKVVYIRMPLRLAQRLERMTRGPYTVAAAALVERGLDELERTHKKLVVDQA